MDRERPEDFTAWFPPAWRIVAARISSIKSGGWVAITGLHGYRHGHHEHRAGAAARAGGHRRAHAQLAHDADAAGDRDAIDGKAIAAAERAAVKAGAERFAAKHGRNPGLATILIGDDAASTVYVGSKAKACAEVGFESFGHVLPGDVSRDEVLALIDRLNADPAVDGILCQLPAPPHIDGTELAARVSPAKDVDGLSPSSAGLLALGLNGCARARRWA